jgi:hypothetical protein
MQISRRDVTKLFGISAATSAVGYAPLALTAEIQPVRMPLEEFVQVPRLLDALRRGVREMKRRKPSDPLSWFYQAAIHGVTEAAIESAAKDDPGVQRVFRKRYWNQCPHDGENSANFLPWHRGYTYHFEKILRLHSGEADFALPYWNYTDRRNRKFPREFGIQRLDGNLQNDAPENINPLFLGERDFYFTGYEHPFAEGLPLLELSDGAVDVSLPMHSQVFFGETEREGLGGGIADEEPSTRGLLESYPHDHIHRAVGGIVTSPDGTTGAGAMATPPTAGFDPIFPIHHANIDRLWAEWSLIPGKKWGKLPSPYWFNERPWFFFDTDGKAVNQPRKAYFDYRALGIRFKYEDLNATPLPLPSLEGAALASADVRAASPVRRLESIAKVDIDARVLPTGRTVLPVPPALVTRLAPLRANALDGGGQRVVMQLQDVRLGLVEGTGFDVHVTVAPDKGLTRTSASFVGSIALFRHEVSGGRGGAGHGIHPAGGSNETFDVSRALAAVESAKVQELKLVLVPYSLLTVPQRTAVFAARDALKFRAVEFAVVQ